MRYPALIVFISCVFSFSANAETMNEKERVIHIANRLTYGPAPGTISYIEQVGMENFIEGQLHPENFSAQPDLQNKLSNLKTLDTPLMELVSEYAPPMKQGGMKPSKEEEQEARKRANIIVQDLAQAKIERGVQSNAQLQELLTDFWYNHFNVFSEKERDRLYVSSYERDAIRPHTLGKFRDLLEATAKHPAMLVYLDNWLNTQPSSQGAKGKQSGINENYAREIMELHTMGVDGGYTQEDVTTLAHILTGWGLSKGKTMQEKSAFEFEPKRHDFSDKVFLGKKIKGSGADEIEQALDIIARHPSTAHHISYQLAQFFVADNPPEPLVKKMAEAFKKTDGNIADVLRSMFKSPEFWDKKYYRCKFKPPLRYVVSALRATNINVDDNLKILPVLNNMGEPMYRYLTPDGYTNTSEHWLNSDALLKRIEVAKRLHKAANDNSTNISAPYLMELLGNNFSQQTQDAIMKAPANLQPVMVLSSPEFLYY